MHPSAESLNRDIAAASQPVLDMLSRYGKESYFPALGIMAQAAEAKKKANKYNATIGIATENGTAMHLKCIKDMISGLSAGEIFPYAPSNGIPALCAAWQEKMVKENPSLAGKTFSNPIVTNALTHGLSLVGDLFIDKEDQVVVPHHFWENYELLYSTKLGAKLKYFDLYNDNRRFNVEGFRQALMEALKEKGKAITVLNFPNNPTGYALYEEEAPLIAEVIKEVSAHGKVVVVCDDAYYSLFFDDNMFTESLFGLLADCNENVLAIKIDGATKEEFVWGLRVGFITFATKASGDTSKLYHALEQKTSGAIRASVSNISNLSQNLVLKALTHPDFEKQKQEKISIMKERALETRRVLDSNAKYKEVWDYYPFNAGYFMCLKLHQLDANTLRLKVLDDFGVGTIALGPTDLRVAFSCLNKDQIQDVFDCIYQAAKSLPNQ